MSILVTLFVPQTIIRRTSKTKKLPLLAFCLTVIIFRINLPSYHPTENAFSRNGLFALAITKRYARHLTSSYVALHRIFLGELGS